MDLNRMKDEDKLQLCRKYYLGGFAFLPFLWAVNSIWFFRQAFLVEEYELQKQIKSYVIRSMIGAITWILLIAAWVTIFQIYRADWGETADRISFVIPFGIA